MGTVTKHTILTYSLENNKTKESHKEGYYNVIREILALEGVEPFKENLEFYINLAENFKILPCSIEFNSTSGVSFYYTINKDDENLPFKISTIDLAVQIRENNIDIRTYLDNEYETTNEYFAQETKKSIIWNVGRYLGINYD